MLPASSFFDQDPDVQHKRLSRLPGNILMRMPKGRETRTHAVI